jgi:hypothetical protein
MEADTRRKAHGEHVRASDAHVDTEAHGTCGVVESFLAHQRTLTALLDEASGFDWRRLRMSSPVVRLPLRFNLGDVFSILVVHAERHARQMERVVAETS